MFSVKPLASAKPINPPSTSQATLGQLRQDTRPVTKQRHGQESEYKLERFQGLSADQWLSCGCGTEFGKLPPQTRRGNLSMGKVSLSISKHCKAKMEFWWQLESSCLLQILKQRVIFQNKNKKRKKMEK